MNRYLLYLKIFLFITSFNLEAMQKSKERGQEQQSEIDQPIRAKSIQMSTKEIKISFIDALIKGNSALMVDETALHFCAWNHPTVVSYDLKKGLNYFSKLRRKQNGSRKCTTSQPFELAILLLKNLDEDALLDLQKKRFENFMSLKMLGDNFLVHLNDTRDKQLSDQLEEQLGTNDTKDELLFDQLEEQLGGTIQNLTNHQIVEKIELLSKNRMELRQALQSRKHQLIKKAASQQLQLEPASLSEYIVKQTLKYQERLLQTMNKFIQ